MAKIKVGVAGYGTIGQRLADGVAMQGDMELVGIADLAPTLSIRALRENDMIGANNVKYDLYLVDGADKAAFEAKEHVIFVGCFQCVIKTADNIVSAGSLTAGEDDADVQRRERLLFAGLEGQLGAAEGAREERFHRFDVACRRGGGALLDRDDRAVAERRRQLGLISGTCLLKGRDPCHD